MHCRCGVAVIRRCVHWLDSSFSPQISHLSRTFHSPTASVTALQLMPCLLHAAAASRIVLRRHVMKWFCSIQCAFFFSSTSGDESGLWSADVKISLLLKRHGCQRVFCPSVNALTLIGSWSKLGILSTLHTPNSASQNRPEKATRTKVAVTISFKVQKVKWSSHKFERVYMSQSLRILVSFLMPLIRVFACFSAFRCVLSICFSCVSFHSCVGFIGRLSVSF